MSQETEFTLSELMIVAAAEAFRGDGEILVTGIGPLPRIAAGLAKLSFEPGLMMTDGEAYLTEEPVPLGVSRDEVPGFSGWMPYARVFSTLWRGQRHAMVTPVQVDRWAQGNISCLGDFAKPKVQMLGVRGFPGNSISHKNSMLIPAHSKRVFIEGEVDVVCSVGFSDERWPEGMRRPEVQFGRIVTDLCVMDFNGPDHASRVLSLHPGVSFDMVQEATGFPLLAAEGMGETPAPTAEQLEIIRRLDPRDMRAHAVKGNPPGVRQAA
ncbi:CoA-transferase subunit beta [Oceanicola sp. S124]|uniref:CoA-transferase subunit beta n=1 Tax=Oceanicola sp. S124 TaxID=1042378 RepID=UPI0002557913|nr:CoA transferase subunit beta [Oceanicola sp. S124]